MKRNRQSSKNQQTIQVWTYDQARSLVPYLSSILDSLREARLEAQAHALRAAKLEAKHGRPTRDQILETEDEKAKAREAEERFTKAQEELQQLDVYCIHPIQGLALIPFVHEDQLAWFIFDRYDEDPLRFWRFHLDAVDVKHPIEAMQKAAPVAAEGTGLA
jgi:Uncharacterized conserved protein (DUF2203)